MIALTSTLELQVAPPASWYHGKSPSALWEPSNSLLVMMCTGSRPKGARQGASTRHLGQGHPYVSDRVATPTAPAGAAPRCVHPDIV